jgi:UDP-glucuronate decarboxylase
VKILVTGVTGIIGKELFPKLISKFSDSVFIIITRNFDSVSFKNFKNFKIIELDILKSSNQEIEKAFIEYKPDLFIHLAWYTHHKDYLSSKINLDWVSKTKILIDFFYDYGGLRFVGLGSCIEYDWTSQFPFDVKNTKLFGNNTLYGESKIEIYNYLKDRGKAFVWLRVFFVFGPNQSETRLIPSLINSYINDEKIFKTNLMIKRDFISTYEISRQICLILKTDLNGAINICSGKSYYIKQLSEIIGKKFKNKLKLIEKEDNNQIVDFYGSQNELLEYYPKYEYNSIEKDLIKTVNHYKTKCKK